MKLRKELIPPTLDEGLVARLAELVDAIDGNPSEALCAEFNKLAGTDLTVSVFQGIYGSENHANFVRRLLRKKSIKTVRDTTRGELIEIVRLAMKPDRTGLHEAYMAIFDCNVPRPYASNLIFYPNDYDPNSNTWGGGRPMSDYAPSPEQIVDWAFDTTASTR